MIGRDELRERLDYNLLTGDFTWKKSFGSQSKVGEVAGHTRKDGYKSIRLDGKSYLTHRLAFQYMLGWIPDMVDHIDRDPSNNSWVNLRPATRSINEHNSGAYKSNKLNERNIIFLKNRGTYQVNFLLNGIKHYVGSFKTLTEAILKRDAYKESLGL